MYLKFIDGENKDAIMFLMNEIGHVEGSDRFILGCRDALGLYDEKLVWWIDLFSKYHKHNDFSYESLLRTRKHFKNIAFTYLDNSNYNMFNTWIKNWSNVLIVCRHSYPEKWSVKNLETTK